MLRVGRQRDLRNVPQALVRGGPQVRIGVGQLRPAHDVQQEALEHAALRACRHEGGEDHHRAALDVVEGHAAAGALVPRARVVAVVSVVASHERLSNRGETRYDWQHYIPVIQRKPGALRNGAPFNDMPLPLIQLQKHLLKREGGDRVMAQVLAVVPEHGVEAVVVAVELALESGRPSAEHVLNVLARLKQPLSLPESITGDWLLQEAPQANVERYDLWRSPLDAQEVNHVD